MTEEERNRLWERRIGDWAAYVLTFLAVTTAAVLIALYPTR